MKIEDVTGAIAAGRVLITDHAHEKQTPTISSLDEIYYATLHGEIIESYPADWPYPSCLTFGETFSREPVHHHLGLQRKEPWRCPHNCLPAGPRVVGKL